MTSAAATTTPSNGSLGGLWQALKGFVTPAFFTKPVKESHQMLVFLYDKYEGTMHLVPAAQFGGQFPKVRRFELLLDRQRCLLRVAKLVHPFQCENSRVYVGSTSTMINGQNVRLHAMLFRLTQAHRIENRRHWVCDECTFKDNPVMAELYARAVP